MHLEQIKVIKNGYDMAVKIKIYRRRGRSRHPGEKYPGTGLKKITIVGSLDIDQRE